jgi:hypothetical protein
MAIMDHRPGTSTGSSDSDPDQTICGIGRDIARMIDTVIAARGRAGIPVNNAMKIVPGKLQALPEAACATTGRRLSGGRID